MTYVYNRIYVHSDVSIRVQHRTNSSSNRHIYIILNIYIYIYYTYSMAHTFTAMIIVMTITTSTNDINHVSRSPISSMSLFFCVVLSLSVVLLVCSPTIYIYMLLYSVT